MTHRMWLGPVRGFNRVVLSLPTGSPAEALMRLALDRLPSLAPG